eukprot:s308_g69.t1
MTESQVEQASEGLCEVPLDAQLWDVPEDSQPPNSENMEEDGLDENMKEEGREQGEEESKTDDELVEPVLCHEMFEAMEAEEEKDAQSSQQDAQEFGAATQGDDRTSQNDKHKQSQCEPSKEPEQATGPVTAGEPGDPPKPVPLSPIGLAIDLDSDEKKPKKKKAKTAQTTKTAEEEHGTKGTHKDHLIPIPIMWFLVFGMSCLIFSSVQVLARQCQDRQPLSNLPPDLGEDDSLQAQIELCCKTLNEAKAGNEAQAILRKSIRDTAAEEDLEDPDRQYKDDSDSDAPKNNRGRGKGRGRGRGRARGRGKAKQPTEAETTEQPTEAETTAADALESLEARNKQACPEMPTHVLPKNLEPALEEAAQYVEKDVKESQLAPPDGEKKPDETENKPSRTAAKTKAAKAEGPRKRKAATPKKKQKKQAANPDTENQPEADAAEKHVASEPSSGSKPETSTEVVSTPEKPKSHKGKEGTPRKTPKTSPKKARKKKYQDSP